MTADDFREIALGMDGATESTHMGHPDFRVRRKIFATLRADETAGVIKLRPEERRELIRQHGKMFTPVNGAWGRQGWTTVRLDVADKAAVRGAMLLAWQHVLEKAPRRRSKV